MPANKYQQKIRKQLIALIGCPPSYYDTRKDGTIRYKWVGWETSRKTGIPRDHVAAYLEEQSKQIKGKGIEVQFNPGPPGHWVGSELAIRVAPIGGAINKFQGRKAGVLTVDLWIIQEDVKEIVGCCVPKSRIDDYVGVWRKKGTLCYWNPHNKTWEEMECECPIDSEYVSELSY